MKSTTYIVDIEEQPGGGIEARVTRNDGKWNEERFERVGKADSYTEIAHVIASDFGRESGRSD